MEGYDGYGYDQQKPRFLRCFRYRFVSKIGPCHLIA